MAGRLSEFRSPSACDLLPAGKDSAAIAIRSPAQTFLFPLFAVQ
jgi:hypothetical protein